MNPNHTLPKLLAIIGLFLFTVILTTITCKKEKFSIIIGRKWFISITMFLSLCVAICGNFIWDMK